jgi:hypothetical protein
VRERRGLVLGFFAIVGLLFLAAITLLFQVVYPAARRQPLAAQRILLLDRASPISRPILDAVSDRDFLLLHPSSNIARPLSEHVPIFTPSFQGFDFTPRDFIATTTAPSALPRIFRPDVAPLPPLEKPVSRAAAVPAGKPQVLQPLVTEGLADRPLRHSISLTGSGLALAEGTGYRIAVDARGHIAFVVPLQETAAQPEATAAFKVVRDQLEQLRFAPVDSTALQWGTLTLRWREATPAP